MKAKRIGIVLLAAALLCAGCGSKGMQAEVWVDYYQSDDMPWGESRTLTLPEFPGVTFTWTSDEVTASQGDNVTTLFTGMPIWNVYLCDLTGDGKPEFCTTTGWGSGLYWESITAYDYASGKSYVLSGMGGDSLCNCALLTKGGTLQAVQSEWTGQNPTGPEISRGTLALVPDSAGDLQLAIEN